MSDIRYVKASLAYFSLIDYFYPLVSMEKQIHRRTHRLSMNRPTKRGKEKSPSNGHYQCERDGRPFTGGQQILETAT
jgi:hypothetical protein